MEEPSAAGPDCKGASPRRRKKAVLDWLEDLKAMVP